MGLLRLLYPLEPSQETLTSEQLQYFNWMLAALIARIKLEGINSDLLELDFDGNRNPLPFPDLHWELATCWMLIDGTLPPPIQVNENTIIDYQSSLLRHPTSIASWKKKIAYARTGFRAR